MGGFKRNEEVEEAVDALLACFLVVEKACGEETVTLHGIQGLLPREQRGETGQVCGGEVLREVVILVASKGAQDVGRVAMGEAQRLRGDVGLTELEELTQLLSQLLGRNSELLVSDGFEDVRNLESTEKPTLWI